MKENIEPFTLFGRWISFLLECPLYHELRKTYIKPYYWKRLNMPELIELMKTENKIELRNVSMFIMKSFEIRKKHLYFD